MRKISICIIIVLTLFQAGCSTLFQDSKKWYEKENSDRAVIDTEFMTWIEYSVNQPNDDNPIYQWDVNLSGITETLKYTFKTKSGNDEEINGQVIYRIQASSPLNFRITDDIGTDLFRHGLTSQDYSVDLILDYDKTYHIYVKRVMGPNQYNLKVYSPNGIIKVEPNQNSHLIIKDAFRYDNQYTYYEYTPIQSGKHYFSTDVSVNWLIKELDGKEVYSFNAGRMDATVKLEQNVTYTIRLNQRASFGNFDLRILAPSSPLTLFNDEIREVRINDKSNFKGQEVTYVFTAKYTTLKVFSDIRISEFKILDQNGNPLHKSKISTLSSGRTPEYSVFSLEENQLYKIVMTLDDLPRDFSIFIRH